MSPARCLRCHAGAEWIEGSVPSEQKRNRRVRSFFRPLPRFTVEEAAGLWCVFWGTGGLYVWGVERRQEAENLVHGLNRRLDEIIAGKQVTRRNSK